MSSVVSTALNHHHRSEPSGVHVSPPRSTTVESHPTQQHLQGMQAAQTEGQVPTSGANPSDIPGARNIEAGVGGAKGSEGDVEDEETRWLKSLPDAELPDAFEDEPATPPQKGFSGSFARTQAADDSGVAALANLEPFGTPGGSIPATSTISNSSSRGGTRAVTTPLMPRNPAAWASQSQPYAIPMDPTSAATLAASGAFDTGLPSLSLANTTWSGQDDTHMPTPWPSYTAQQQQPDNQNYQQQQQQQQQQRSRQQLSAPGSTSISPPLAVENNTLPPQTSTQQPSQGGAGGFQPVLQGGPPQQHLQQPHQHQHQHQQPRTKSLSAEPNVMYGGGAGMMLPPSGAPEWMVGPPYVPATATRGGPGIYQHQALRVHGQQHQLQHQSHLGPRGPSAAPHVSQLQPIPQEHVAPPQPQQQQQQQQPHTAQQGQQPPQQQFPPQPYTPHQPGLMPPPNHRYMRAHSEPGPGMQLPPPGASHTTPHTPQQHYGAVMEEPFAPFVFPGAPIGRATEFNRDSRDTRRRPSSGRGGADRTAPRRGHNSLSSAFRRLNLDSNTRLRDLSGRIVELSADQHGSRMIQHCIESATPAEMHKVLEEIGEQLYQVMTDVFGNYVIQKLLQYGDGTVQHTIVHGMQGRVPALSMHNYGCRVVQEVLATVTSVELRNLVLEELESYNVSDLIMDQHANHVIQKCVTSLPTDNLGFVITACERQASTMSRHLYGCRVIQRLIEQCEPEQLEVVYTNVLSDCSLLMKNAYGNYVIQHVLEHGKQEHRDTVMDSVSGNLLTLSQHKFASNVVEKFLRVARADQISSLVAELCHSTALPDGTTAAPLHVMMKDKYANYVIQTLMQCSPQQTQTALLDYIHANRDVLRGYTYGKHIVAKAEALRSQRR